VCLHCRHEERMIARAKQQKLVTQIGLGIVGLAIATVVGVAGGTALQGNRGAEPNAGARNPAAKKPVATATARATATANEGSIAQQGVATPRRDSVSREPLVPVIAEGRSELRDSIFALRQGATVEVQFDRPMARTRRPEKFERIVRMTLPLVYGAAADSLLVRMRDGEIAAAGDLLAELPERGLHWPVGNGMMMSLYPVTRPGQDGPLVVTYRVSVAGSP
jgi:hypothetical protein